MPDYVKIEIVHSSSQFGNPISRPYCMYEKPYQTTGLTDSEDDEEDEKYDMRKDPELNIVTTEQVNRWNPDRPQLIEYTLSALNIHDINSEDDEFIESGFDEVDPMYFSDDDSSDNDFKEGETSGRTKLVRVKEGFVLNTLQEDMN